MPPTVSEHLVLKDQLKHVKTICCFWDLPDVFLGTVITHVCKTCASQIGPFRLRNRVLTKIIETAIGSFAEVWSWTSTSSSKINFLLPKSHAQRLIVRSLNVWWSAKGTLVVWVGVLDSWHPFSERDCYLGVALDSQTRIQNTCDIPLYY